MHVWKEKNDNKVCLDELARSIPNLARTSSLTRGLYNEEIKTIAFYCGLGR